MAEAYEEQTQYNAEYECYNSGGWQRIGQHLIIPNRLVTKVGLWARRASLPNGNTYVGIRKASDDALIAEQLWGLSNDVPYAVTLIEVTLSSPIQIDDDVRIFIRTTDGQHSPQKAIMVQYQNTNVKVGECFSRYSGPGRAWTDLGTDPNSWDTAYRYTYEEQLPPGGGGDPAAFVAAGVI